MGKRARAAISPTASSSSQEEPPKMRRKRLPPVCHVIRENAVYTPAQVRRLLGLKEHSLDREIRKGRLRAIQRCSWYYILGEHLLEWLRNGERRVSRAPGEPGPQ